MELLWCHRIFLIDNPRALPKFLMSVNWAKPERVAEAHWLLEKWAPPSHVQALEVVFLEAF